MTRRIRLGLAFGVVAGAMVLVPSGAALADDDSQAMEAHMTRMPDNAMDQTMENPACMNMMEAPPFGGDSPHAP